LLLEVDGLDHPWDGVCIPTSAWDGELGELEEEEVPMAMRRALSPASIREYDTSSFGTPRTLNTDEMIDTSAEVVENEGGVRYVRKLSLDYFRSRLVEHFNIMWKQHKIMWPKRRGKVPQSYLDDDEPRATLV
jgi:hypothetical protein